MGKPLIWLCVAALLSICIACTPWILAFHDSGWSRDPAEWGQFGDYIGGVLATILAAFSFGGLLYTVWIQDHHMRNDRQMREDETYLNHSIRCLERAFEALQSPAIEGPVRSRVMWLTAARWLLNASKSSALIRSEGVRLLYEGAEEDWRNRFRLFLDPDRFGYTMQGSFFQSMGTDIGLEPNSVYAIYSFLFWPDSRPDEIESIGRWDISRISLRYRGARNFLIGVMERRGVASESALADDGSAE